MEIVGKEVSETLAELDAISEMIALTSTGNTKNLIVAAVELRGNLDVQAFGRATELAIRGFPQLLCRLREVRTGRRHRLYWDRAPDQSFPFIVSELPPGASPAHALTAFLEQSAPFLDRDWDLFQEPPVRLHVAKVATEHYVVGPIVHHVASDGGIAVEFGRAILAHYHELKTGSVPEWGLGGIPMSTMRKRMVQVEEGGFKDFLRKAGSGLTPLFERPTLPIGSGLKHDTRQHHVKRVLSMEQTAHLVSLAAKQKTSQIDLFVCATNLAIDGWNEARNTPPGTLTTSITVNMKGRFRQVQGPNNSAVLFFKSKPEERKNLESFLREVSLARIRHFRRNMDFRYYENVCKLTDSLRPFPFKIRRKITSFLIQRHQVSIGVTLLGILWPEIRDGKLTGNSPTVKTADVEVTEIHGVGYKLLSDTRLLLIVYVYGGRLNLILASSACLFTREEAEQFLDLIVDNLLQPAGI
ncbi:MAG: hypothetical protein AB1646_02060 [Thermodesulfobacteriota bacterium]